MSNEWINEEIEKSEKDKKERGIREFVKFPEGETKLEINLDEAPRNVISNLNGKPQKILTVKQDGEEGEYNYGLHPFALTKLLKVLVDAELNTGWVKLTVIRAGLGPVKTRYTFKAGWD